MSRQNESVQIVDLAMNQQRIIAFLAKYAESCNVTVGVMRIRLQGRA